MVKPKFIVRLFFLIMLFWVGSPAHATLFTLTDGNSTVNVDDQIFDIPSFNVDSTEHSFEQFFYFRHEGDTSETQIQESSYTRLSSTQTAANALVIEWQLASGLTMEVEYVLNGGAVGSGSSILTENITITSDFGNTFSLFAYVDFDLDEEEEGQSASFDGVKEICQQDDDNLFDACMRSDTAPDFWEISEYSDTQDKLENGVVNDLANTESPFGPGDATFAFQWDSTLLDTESFAVTLTKTINRTGVVSEPGITSLILLSLAGAGFVRRKKKH